MKQQRNMGFTLVELLITLAILVILVTGAIPAMRDMIERQRLYHAAETLAADLRLFRSEALSRNQDHITVTFAEGSDWCYGVAEEACDCHALIDEADSCTLPRNQTLYRFTRHASAFSGIDLVRASFFQGSELRFDGFRGLGQPGTVTVANAAGQQLDIKVSLLGRVRICTPEGQPSGRYPAC